jgi:DNA-binding transcriptional LysR family regulator
MILSNAPDEPPQIVASGFHSLGEILPGTNMVALLPYRVANRLAQMHGLRTLPIDFACGRPELRMLWHAERDRDAGHKWMREQVAISGAAISVERGDLADGARSPADRRQSVKCPAT